MKLGPTRVGPHDLVSFQHFPKLAVGRTNRWDDLPILPLCGINVAFAWREIRGLPGPQFHCSVGLHKVSVCELYERSLDSLLAVGRKVERRGVRMIVVKRRRSGKSFTIIILTPVLIFSDPSSG